jgi:hypothetical protein
MPPKVRSTGGAAFRNHVVLNFEEQHMLDQLDSDATQPAIEAIRLNDVSPPIAIPRGHIGPVTLPGSGRQIWWTGRVAIGLRHQQPVHSTAVSRSALWLQDLMLNGQCRAA